LVVWRDATVLPKVWLAIRFLAELDGDIDPSKGGASTQTA
jgi:hypothetical protein